MQQWTQDEAIAFKCARDAIVHLMAIQSAEIHDEKSKAIPDINRLASLDAERSRLHRERSALHINHHAEIARIRREYGSILRNRRTEFQSLQNSLRSKLRYAA